MNNIFMSKEKKIIYFTVKKYIQILDKIYCCVYRFLMVNCFSNNGIWIVLKLPFKHRSLLLHFSCYLYICKYSVISLKFRVLIACQGSIIDDYDYFIQYRFQIISQAWNKKHQKLLFLKMIDETFSNYHYLI